jgi:MoaA/NifB/PqqE/SkfB family radical SAM enzyme
MTSPIQRICFNFSSSCNMRCSYCYIPFSKSAVDQDVCLRVIERCRELGTQVITIGGGDPFVYGFLPSLVRRAREVGLETHLDTNGLRVCDRDFAWMASTISLLGLPLDGPDDICHDRMRNAAGHFKKVLAVARRARDYGIRCKINTVVSRLNFGAISSMSPVVASLAPERWSLYQYWPLAHGELAFEIHRISELEFRSAVGQLGTDHAACTVEINTVASRSGRYFFVSHTGQVYTHDPFDDSRYVFLGSIFDDITIDNWHRTAQGSLRPVIVSRYSSVR